MTSEVVSPKKNFTQNRRRKKLKWRKVSKELVAFKCRRDAENSSMYFLNSNFNEEETNTDIDLDVSSFPFMWHEHEYTSSSVVNCIILSDRLENPNKYSNTVDRSTDFNNIKKLVKSNQLKSLVHKKRRFEFHLGSITKGNTILHLKYNIYKKLNESNDLNEYVPVIQRFRYINAPKRVDARHKIDPAFLAENKKFLKSIKKLDLSVREKNRRSTISENQHHDTRVVIDNSLNHSVRGEDFDATYLEFLIQLQHRDITPEDYEFLTRLDERIKKKTLDEEILKKLRTETVENTYHDECCGICLDCYHIGCLVRYLPCGHRFHAECIDNWLKNQSVNCPLDNLPINGLVNTSNDQRCDITYEDSDSDVGNYSFNDLFEIDEEDAKNSEVEMAMTDMLNQICENLVLDEEVQSVLNSLLNNLC